jgi:hypothetical protein
MELNYCDSCEFLIHIDDLITSNCCKNKFHKNCLHTNEEILYFCTTCITNNPDLFKTLNNICDLCNCLILEDDLIEFLNCKHTYHINCNINDFCSLCNLPKIIKNKNKK